MEPDVGKPSKINRREMLKRAAVAGGVAWAAPVLTSLRTPAFAQYGVPCEEGCTYVVRYTVQPDGSHSGCSECSGPVCHGDPCGTCTGSGCARVTSVQFTDGSGRPTRLCTDCAQGTVAPIETFVCQSCPADCSCAFMAPEADPRCSSVREFVGACRSEVRVFQFHFTCADCTP